MQAKEEKEKSMNDYDDLTTFVFPKIGEGGGGGIKGFCLFLSENDGWGRWGDEQNMQAELGMVFT